MRRTTPNIPDCALPLDEIRTVHGWLTTSTVIVGALCRAMKHGLPLTLTLRGAAENERLRGGEPSRVLLALAQDLEAGMPLADALERHARAFLPPHFIPAVRAAETRGQLPAVLPALAEGIEQRVRAQAATKAALTYPVVQLIVLLNLATGLVVFICPRIHRMFVECGLPEDAYWALNLLVGRSPRPGVLPVTAQTVLLGALGLLALLAVASMLARRIPAVASVWERFWEVMPFAGPVRRQFARLEMADTLSAAVAGNGDLLEALELGYQSCRSPHLRQRLGVCVAAVKRGEPWAAAWEAAGLGAPFQYWILRNAAARQDPFSGFILLRDWLAEDVDRRVKRLCLWIEPCMTCLNSALFAFVIFAFWNPMMYLIFECMKT